MKCSGNSDFCECKECKFQRYKMKHAIENMENYIRDIKEWCGKGYDTDNITADDIAACTRGYGFSLKTNHNYVYVTCAKHGDKCLVEDIRQWNKNSKKPSWERDQEQKMPCEACDRERESEIIAESLKKKEESTTLRRECLRMLKEQYGKSLKYHRISRAKGHFTKSTRYEVECVEHGYFTTTVSKLLSGIGCKKCGGFKVRAKSKGESIAKKVLLQSGVDFMEQWHVDLSKLSDEYSHGFFDFKVGNFLVEIDGEQHDFPVAFNGDLQSAIENYQRGAERDVLKNMFAQDAGMTVIRIRRIEWSLSKCGKTWEQYTEKKLTEFLEENKNALISKLEAVR